MIEEETQQRGLSLGMKLTFACLITMALAGAIYNFWPSNVEAKAETATVNVPLAGILYADDNPAAVIDKNIIHEGDVVDGVTVVRIGPAEVEFEKGGNHWTQQLKKNPSGSTN